MNAARQVGDRGARPLVAGVVALAALASQLPGPGSVIAMVSGSTTGAQVGARVGAQLGVADTAALIVASCVVWPLLVWGLTVVLLTALCRVPGMLGGAALRGLRMLVPRALRPLLVAGVGISLAAGLAGCSQPGGAGSGAAAAGQGSAATAPLTAVLRMAGEVGSAPRTPPAAQPGPVAQGIATAVAPVAAAAPRAPHDFDLDWPTSAAELPAPAPGRAATTDRGQSPAAQVGSIAIDWPQTARSRDALPATAHHSRTAEPNRVSPGHPVVSPHPARATPAPVTVRTGDTLWSIAASRLPADATDLRIDESWRSWYAANSALIGPDPNLILPGQQLLPPTPGDHS